MLASECRPPALQTAVTLQVYVCLSFCLLEVAFLSEDVSVRAPLQTCEMVLACLPVLMQRVENFRKYTIGVAGCDLSRPGSLMTAAAIPGQHVAHVRFTVALENAVTDLNRDELVVATVRKTHRDVRGRKYIVNQETISARQIAQTAHIGDY